MRIIGKKRWYRPREIAQQKLLATGESTDSNYVFILELIKSGQLKAKNVSKSPKAVYWMVSDDEIRRYQRKFNKKGLF